MMNGTMAWILVAVAVLFGLGMYSWYSGHNSGEYAEQNGLYAVEPAAGDISGSVPMMDTGEVRDGNEIALTNLGTIPGITGMYAADEAACISAPWHIEDTRIITNGNARCELQSLQQSGVSYTVIVQCSPQDSGGPEVWEVSQPTSDTLAVARPGGSPITLIRCGATGS